MECGLTYIEKCSAYPGEYIPMPEIEKLLNDKKNCMKQPPLNVDEYDIFFRIEVSLPGTHKQDIVVSVEGHILSIKVIHKDDNRTVSRSWIHEFDMNYFEREVTLPDDADTEFATAEYKEGILTLLIPKVANHSKVHPGIIVVY